MGGKRINPRIYLKIINPPYLVPFELELIPFEGDTIPLKENLLESDLFEKVSGRFDLIVSNPPYIPADELSGLMEEVGRYEPRLALDGKEDGLSFYHRIVAQAGDYLRGGGALFFEVGCGQAEAVKGMMEKEGYRDITVVKDYAGIDRVVYGWKWK